MQLSYNKVARTARGQTVNDLLNDGKYGIYFMQDQGIHNQSNKAANKLNSAIVWLC